VTEGQDAEGRRAKRVGQQRIVLRRRIRTERGGGSSSGYSDLLQPNGIERHRTRIQSASPLTAFLVFPSLKYPEIENSDQHKVEESNQGKRWCMPNLKDDWYPAQQEKCANDLQIHPSTCT
jgi:hypothetical protein